MLLNFCTAKPANSGKVVRKLMLFVGDSLSGRPRVTGPLSTEGFIFRRGASVDC